MCIKTHLDNTLYLSSLWSDLSCAAELVIGGAPAGFYIDTHPQPPPTTSQPPLSSTTSSDTGLSRKMLQQRDAQKCSPFPVPSVTLTVPYSPFPIPDAPVLSQPPLTTAASTQPTSPNTSSSSETPQQEDRPRSTAAQLPLLHWALSVPGLEEPVDLTVDLRAQTPGT